VKYTYSWAFLRFLKVLRLGKILRVFRVMRYLRGVRNIFISMWASSSQFLSACVVTFMGIYATSLILVQGVTFEVQLNSVEWVALDEETQQQITRLYGSVNNAMMLLFWTISGGMEWSRAQALVEPLDTVLSVVWVMYMAFVMFGLLNIMVSIFVESVIQAIPRENQRIYSEGLAAIFKFADINQDGYLDKKEFRALLMDPHLLVAADELGIRQKVLDITESLATDKSGKISLEDFQKNSLAQPARR